MEGPRAPLQTEYPKVVEFLNKSLRSDYNWSIANEYPTAIAPNNLNNMRIIEDKGEVVSHAVLKPLIVRSPSIIFKVGAIGSVVTDEDHRNQGLSRKILDDCLKLAEVQNCDIAILWTNLYDFYRKLGFELGGTEIGVLIDHEIKTSAAAGLRFMKSSKISPEALLRVYNQHPVNSVRTLEDVRKFMNIPNTVIYSAWDSSNQLVAYAVEGKGADLKNYIHEWGGSVSKLIALISHIRADKQEPITVIVPRNAINLIGQLRGLDVTFNDGFLGMIKIIQPEQLFAKIHRAAKASGLNGLVLNKTANGIELGYEQEVVLLAEESDLVKLIFGPKTPQEFDLFSSETAKVLARIFPLPFWIWGWDSV